MAEANQAHGCEAHRLLKGLRLWQLHLQNEAADAWPQGVVELGDRPSKALSRLACKEEALPDGPGRLQEIKELNNLCLPED